MLKVEITNEENKYTLTMDGHCNTAPKGHDLVCAAASILCLTLAQVIEENADKLEEEPTIDLNDGDAKISFVPQEKFKGALMNSLYTVTTGLKVLQHNHPDVIEVK